MSSTDTYPPAPSRSGPYDRPSWGRQVWSGVRGAVDWLDDKGRGAWIAAVVAGFFLAPPVGIALLLFTLGTGRMFSRHHRDGHRSMTCGSRRGRMEAWSNARAAARPSGNRAFDAYKAETLRRLEEEQRSFEEFLGRLREAKDKAEFDQFMEDRARRASDRSDDRSPDGDDAAA